MHKNLTSLRLVLFMTLLTGFLYPLLILGFAMLFPLKSTGEIIMHQNKVVGARLIGQKFESDTYFYSRPSSNDYNPLSSGGSNLSATDLTLRNLVALRREKLQGVHGKDKIIPSELLFASGSGLDPHISKKTALYQVDRIIKARSLDSSYKAKIEELIEAQTNKFSYLKLNRPYVNVLLLNIALDNLTEKRSTP